MQNVFDRIIDKHELRLLVPYSGTHISRLELAGTFPRRLKLGANRVGWSLNEVEGWIEAKKAARDETSTIQGAELQRLAA